MAYIVFGGKVNAISNNIVTKKKIEIMYRF